ncbi:MAG: cation:proton antiporter [Thermoanaerobaculia bacterium]|nr:cation:proton antiporter [Thermoanaerobaculia bacterium]
MDLAQFLLVLIAIFASAKLFGELAERVGQPAVLGELIAGLVVGVSGLQIVDPQNHTIHLLAELGVVLLLFMIGLETDLKKLLSVGASSTAVAVVGVVVPFVLGYFAGVYLGYGAMISIFLGATLTATSVGITARVLSDLGHLQDRESQVILGAAVIDDILGLILLTIVGALSRGEDLTVLGVAKTTLIAFGFVVVAIVLGNWLAPALISLITRLRVAKALFFASVMFAFALAFLAEEVGSAMIIGAFAAGLVLARTKRSDQIEREVHDIAQFFVPIFFVSVGSAVDLRTLNPIDPDARRFLVIGVVLTVIAIIGKLVAGWGAIGKGLKRHVIGIGMIPRGEVGLIFAQIGLSTGVLATGLYSSVTMMVIVTTLVVPPLLRMFLVPGTPDVRREGVAQYVSEAPQDRD